MNMKLLFIALALIISSISHAQVANHPTDYRLCDMDNEGLAEFDLTFKDAEILQGQDPSEFVVTYHVSQFQAESGNGYLSSPYQNTTNPEQIWAKVEELSTGNFDTTFFNLVVLDAPIIPDTDLYICDDDADGEVELNFATTESGYSLSYHLTVVDAEQNINALSFPITYLAENIPTQLYARSENADGCFYVVPRILYYGTGIVANTLTPLEACGNNGTAQFYLPYKNDEVTGGLPLFVRYYLTENDAQNGSGYLPSTYTNTSNPQTIYARVSNIACYDVTPLELIANEGDVLNLSSIEEQFVCDWPSPYDVTQHETLLLQNEDPTNLVVSYFTSLGDLYSQTNQISNPTQFVLAAPNEEEIIYIRVENAISGCFNFKSFSLEGKEDFELNSITLSACDANGDGLEVFNLLANYSEIRNGSNVNLRMYETEADALNDVNYIWPSSAYESGNATIYAKGYYSDTDCFEIVPINLELQSGPELTNSTYGVCDYNSNGGEAVELFFIEEFVISNLDDNLSYNINFFETESDALIYVSEISTPVNVFTNGTTIFARITVIGSDNCVSVQPVNLELLTLPNITNFLPMYGCDDDNDGFAEFDFTPNRDVILNQYPDVIVTFHPTFLNASSGSDALPLTYLTDNSQIFIRVFNPQTGCYRLFILPLQYFCDEPIDCGSGPVNDSFCYVDEDTAIYPYSSSNGLPLTVVFNSGQVENNFDQLIVLDSDGVTNLNANTPYGNDGDLTGLEFTSSGGQITIKVESDNSNSCQSQGYSPLDFDVSCLDSSIIPNCDASLLQPLNGSTDVDVNLSLEWTAATNFPSGYKFTIGTTAGGNDVLDNFDVGNVLTYDFNNLDYETTYFVTILPYNTNGDATGCIEESFTTMANPNQIVQCGDVPYNVVYCYTVDDTTTFTFQSSNGSPLTVVFNSGEIEVSYDFLYVFDSDGTDINGAPWGNNGDLSGLVFQSSGDTITIEINSDYSISCETENYEPWDFDVFCSNSVGYIEVNAFQDANNNSVFDTNEVNFNNGYFTYELNGDGIINTVNSSTGSFQIISGSQTDTYDIAYNLYDESAGCYDITTSNFNNITVATGNTITIDFPVIEEQNCEDLGVFLINNWTPPRPGFSHENQLVLENFGFTTIASGTVEFISNSPLEFDDILNVNPAYTITNTATGFTVDFVNLQPGDVETINISVLCPAEVALDDVVTSSATYLTDSNDLVPDNNFSSLSEVVIGSWDPNDKMEAHGPKVVYDEFTASDEWLYYTIRFQNLGTAAAEFVRIEDVLDVSLDETSFQMLRASHDYVVTRTETDLEWYFEDINLPAEQDDAEGSNGFVYFRIKPKAGYAIGDVIPNTAAIYFDFNAPVITNTFETEFVEDALSVSEFDVNGFDMYPNPAKDILNIKLNNISKANLSIYDIQGKLILEHSITETQNLEIKVSDLQSGLYFVKLNTATKEMVKKLIIE